MQKEVKAPWDGISVSSYTWYAMREVNCLTLSQILMTDLGCLEGITDMVGSIQEFLQRQARHIEERDAILLHQRLEHFFKFSSHLLNSSR